MITYLALESDFARFAGVSGSADASPQGIARVISAAS